MKKTAIIFSFCLSMGATVQADNTYDWTGGAAGYSGQIVLDSSSSAGGTLADIVSGTVTTPSGTYSFDPTTVYEDQTPFSWNASQITSMWIDWTVAAGSKDVGFGEDWDFSGGNFIGSENSDTSDYLVDETDSWVAANGNSVPDASSTLGLFGAAFCGLSWLRRSRSR